MACAHGVLIIDGQRLRDDEDRRREDDRDDAGGVHAQRQVGVRAAVDLAADDALGVLHRDAALRPFHEDDEGDDGDHEDDQAEHREEVALAVADVFDDAEDGVRQVDDDAGEDDQRDAVADAALGDLLTEPHDEGGAGGQREHGHDREAEAPERSPAPAAERAARRRERAAS